jgi:hypothetical protein
MSKLLFFSRVALLCNICFLLTFFMRYVPQLKGGFFISTIVITGLILSILINFVVNLLYIIIQVGFKKPISRFVPVWLVVTNFLFFVVQAILLLK